MAVTISALNLRRSMALLRRRSSSKLLRRSSSHLLLPIPMQHCSARKLELEGLRFYGGWWPRHDSSSTGESTSNASSSYVNNSYSEIKEALHGVNQRFVHQAVNRALDLNIHRPKRRVRRAASMSFSEIKEAVERLHKRYARREEPHQAVNNRDPDLNNHRSKEAIDALVRKDVDHFMRSGSVAGGESDARPIYETIMEGLSQSTIEADVSDGLMSVPLLRHQKIALAWMLQMETGTSPHLGAGGFLADDQGLGKTVSMIALILMQRSLQSKSITDDACNHKTAAGTLIVCPASILRQWARELKEKVSEEHKLTVLVYHGSNRTKDPIELAKYDVVLTTYSIVSNEVPKENDNIDSSIKHASGPLEKVDWFRVILDEAQTIKNHNTKAAKACCSLGAKNRWCLSGTPIQNTINDLYSYFRFLKYDPYDVYDSFYNTIKLPIKTNPTLGYKNLQTILSAIVLRRTKGTLIDGKPIINLPPKTIELTMVDFSVEERAFYRELEADSRSKFEEYAHAKTVDLNLNYTGILVKLLRQRQACNHPRLVKEYHFDPPLKSIGEMAKSLPKEKLIDLFNSLETTSAICCLCKDPPEDPVVTMCGHVFCYECVSDCLNGDDNTSPAPGCEAALADDVFSKTTLRSLLSDELGDSNPIKAHDFDHSLVQQNQYTSSKMKALLEILHSNCKLDSPRSGLLNSAGSHRGSTSSYDSYMKHTRNYSESTTEEPIKTIVFSQWTRMLNLVQASLKQSGIQYGRLDGSMSLAARDRSVKDFNTEPEVTVMLMSLKAGNLGLNMVAASHVILLDPWWNPKTEDQAIDRVHRIGQTRPVTVTRLTIRDTVERRILSLQERKRKMAASAFGEDHTPQNGLTIDDLKYIFDVDFR
ncbi:hypothetical protein PIB30_025010 [Stylosanthes scabra]|uniref:Uncharacterized protein n=1 Tax=Stylosanthes scabra TaxID=79078 RepID=A0ABU6Z7G7_9FABA|nr:hypothetical protein [Stylosanthes scabra]